MSVDEEAAPSDFGDGEGDEDLDLELGEGQDAGAERAAADQGPAGLYNALEVNEQVFEELVLNPGLPEEVQSAWAALLKSAESREAAGEAVFSAIFEAAPSLQGLFKTPRAVMAMRFTNGLHQLVGALQDPRALKVLVETLGFQHMDLEVTEPRVSIFRDAILDLLQTELGERLSIVARDGWCTFLNYVGGAFIYVRVKYADRLRVLASSWATANNRRLEDGVSSGEVGSEGKEVDASGADLEEQRARAARAKAAGSEKAKGPNRASGWARGSGSRARAGGPGSGEPSGEMGFGNTAVPKTYDEMFMFNAAVMGFGGRMWMTEVLSSFGTIVANVNNSYRLQEECDILGLRLGRCRGSVNLGEYKAVMLASLRSLVPKEWNSGHEVAWSWLWDNVERMLKALMGKPAQQERALEQLWTSLTEEQEAHVRREVYAQFFSLAPAGQDYFKQSTSRLHFIVDRLRALTLEIYRDPTKVVEEISAMGLRHVGYGVPTDLFGPFVTACVQVVRRMTDNDLAEQAFRWALSLISRILTRVINEGSTIVMKAINNNSGRMLRKAVSCAPRGKRALWMLNIQVGTQSISPLLWAVETGSLDAAKAIIVDLLTIRGDRDRYYYGVDTLFERHPDVIKRLCVDAPALLPTLLDGLIWRSRTTESGLRRVNYYVKHLLVDAEGDFSMAIEWLTESANPKIACHPVVSLVTDTVWTRAALRAFLRSKTWFIFTIIVFIISQAILNQVHEGPPVNGVPSDLHGFEVRVATFACRCFVYICSMGQWLFYHLKHTLADCRARQFAQVWGPLRGPAYLANWQDRWSLCLTVLLVIMLCLEPILHCIPHADGDIFVTTCEAGELVTPEYSVVSSMAMLLYFLLLKDLSVFSTHVSAFVLVCGLVLSEVSLFLFGFFFIALSFACALSALEMGDEEYSGIFRAGVMLIRITLGMFDGSRYDLMQKDPALLLMVFAYVICTVIFLINLLIAQLSCAYQATYQDMLGYARLNRGKIVVETMPSVAKSRWERFVAGLRLDERISFGEGDIGLAGGLQVFEPATANLTTVDMIRRFGGSTATSAQWPLEPGASEEDPFERMEKMVDKAMKRLAKSSSKSARGSSGAGSSLLVGSMGDSGSTMSGSHASISE